MNERGQGAVAVLVLLFVLAAALYLCVTELSGCTAGITNAIKASQEEQARAAIRATDSAVSIIETREAAKIELTRAFASATVAAMQTRAAYDRDRAKSEAETGVTNQWITTVAFALLVSIGAGTFYYVMRITERKSQVAADTPNGPVLQIGNTTVRTGNMVGSALTVSRPGFVEWVDQMITWVRTRQLPEPAMDRVALFDKGADAKLLAAQAANDSATNAIVGAMSSKLSEQERLARMAMLRGSYQAQTVPPNPNMSISMPTDNAVGGQEGYMLRSILDRLGLQPPAQWQLAAPAQALSQDAPQEAAIDDIQGVIVGG